MKSTFFTATVLAVSMACGMAQNSGVPYQGRLTDATGAPLPNGTSSLTFELYGSPTGGVRVWGPQTTQVDVIDGRFALKLGPLDPGGNAIGEAISNGGKFLSIKVGSDLPLPRQEILPAPRALVADSLSGPIRLSANTNDSINQSHRIYFDENASNENFGFSFVYAGTGAPTIGGQEFPDLRTNTFNLVRHNESTAGEAVMEVHRGSGLVGFSNNVIVHGDSVVLGTLGVGGDVGFEGETTLAGGVAGDTIFRGSAVFGDRVVITSSASADDGFARSALSVGGTSSKINIDGDDIQRYSSNGSPSTLYLNDYGGNVSIGRTGSTTTVDGTFVNSSDRHAKEDVVPVETEAVLERLLEVPMSSWRYIGSEGRRHVGPMAQDFHAAFDELLDLNSDETTIAPLDEAGVAFASIQALHGQLEDARSENAALRARLAAIEAKLGMQVE